MLCAFNKFYTPSFSESYSPLTVLIFGRICISNPNIENNSCRLSHEYTLTNVLSQSRVVRDRGKLDWRFQKTVRLRIDVVLDQVRVTIVRPTSPAVVTDDVVICRIEIGVEVLLDMVVRLIGGVKGNGAPM